MVGTTSIDDLFRQKSLQEIHVILQQTRSDVEAKKTELRELVGDHYRSVLESSDHIRAMSDCAAKVATGSDRVEELIASMRELASNPPVLTPDEMVAPALDKDNEPDAEYRLCLRVMELLELPETVRGMVGDHAFIPAAKTAAVEAPALQQEVQGLLSTVAVSSPAAMPGFDLPMLVSQQAAAYRSLPQQVAAGSLDAFGAANLTPPAAAEAFVANLLLDDASRTGPLLCRFVERRSELLRDILEGQAASFGGNDAEGVISRLIAAAMAFEGTIVLSSALCSSGPGGALPPLLAAAMKSLTQDGKDSKAGPISADSYAIAFRQKIDTITKSFGQHTVGAGSLAGDLSRLGSQFLKCWAPEDSSDGGVRTLTARFRSLVASSALQNCAQLGDLRQVFSERLMSYRRSLAEGVGLGTADWAAVWSGACGLFCPGRGAPKDALTILNTSVEITCAELVRERIGEIKLALVDVGAEAAGGTSTEAPTQEEEEEGDDSRRCEEIAELRRQSQARLLHFDEQVGEILDDVACVSFGGEIPGIITAALLEALEGHLTAACDAVKLQPVQRLWPSVAGQSAPSKLSWPKQRSVARAALALETLLSAAEGNSDKTSTARLGGALKAASSSGNANLASKAESILALLKRRSEEVYCAWARLAVVPGKNLATLMNFWSLADDEVGPACGWGSAKFAGQADQSPSADQSASSKAVPVPTQASPFVFERLVFAAQRALELAGGNVGAAAMSSAAALKAALSELFVAAYEAEQPADLSRLKRSGMSHLLQWLFDLNFLRITLSAAAGPGGAAYEALRELLSKAESAAFSDPVDRLLYQEVLKSSVNSHVQGTKVLLGPFFFHNPLYGFLSQGHAPGSASGAVKGSESAGFEIQATFAPPLRPVLPRFPLLPVANPGASGSQADLDRLRLDPSERARAAAKAGQGDRAGAAVSSLMQQAGGLVGSGLGSLGISSGLWGGGKAGAAGGYPPGQAKPEAM